MSNPNFTTVFMSADIDKYGLVSYLTNQHGQEPAVIELTGRTHPITSKDASKSTDIKEILKAIKDIHENPDAYGGSNAIQVFESGVGEINDMIATVRAKLPPSLQAKTLLLANHAKQTPAQEAPVYRDFDGIKVIIQTNKGKTSNTIARTRYVITTGKERQIIIDDEGAKTLVEIDVSQDCINQQRGRGGRTNSSIFVHTRRDGDKFKPAAELAPHMVPEIQRTPLDDIVMELAARGDSIRTFDWQDRPLPAAIELSVSRMQALGAIDGGEKITALGERMMNFPCGPEGQRCMVESLQYPPRIRLFMAAMVGSTEVGGLKIGRAHV